jgi:hypothetical protein
MGTACGRCRGDARWIDAWSIQNTKNLVVAVHAKQLAVSVYRLTAVFPTSERFGLTAQMRRAAVSIGSNIAATRN